LEVEEPGIAVEAALSQESQEQAQATEEPAMNKTAVSLAFVLLATAPVHAATVRVEVTGQVIFNGIGAPPLGDVDSGDAVAISFTVDSDVFTDGIPGDTRGYAIDQASFVVTFDGVQVGLLDPFPDGRTPYFTLVEGFPVSDGFFISSSPVSPGGVPLAQEPYQLNLDLGYEGDVLASLDILDAQGDYGFDGLTRFSLNLWSVFPDNVNMEMDYSGLSIRAVPVPATLWLLMSALLGTGLMSRRSKADRS
jgi:hypothetical protein